MHRGRVSLQERQQAGRLNRKNANNNNIIHCFALWIQSHRVQMQDQTKCGRMDTNASVVTDRANPTRNPGHGSCWAYLAHSFPAFLMALSPEIPPGSDPPS